VINMLQVIFVGDISTSEEEGCSCFLGDRVNGMPL
jgi:hypothetical protein